MSASAAEQADYLGSLTSLSTSQVLLCRSITRELFGEGYRCAVSVTENLEPRAKFSVSFDPFFSLQKVLPLGLCGSALW